MFIADLSRMYQLLKSIPDGIKHMTKELEEHIKETGELQSFIALSPC